MQMCFLHTSPAEKAGDTNLSRSAPFFQPVTQIWAADKCINVASKCMSVQQ